MKSICRGCGETFSSVGTFDRHRVGKHHIDAGPDRRRCMSVDEMSVDGMRNIAGVWKGEALTDAQKAAMFKNGLIDLEAR